jgi:hypothetical protein
MRQETQIARSPSGDVGPAKKGLLYRSHSPSQRIAPELLKFKSQVNAQSQAYDIFSSDS